MPPLYDWECQKCKKQTTTIVSMSQSDIPPEENKDDKCEEHTWKKVILSAPQKAYGANWGYRKGKGYDW